jgi:hypothetical protein
MWLTVFNFVAHASAKWHKRNEVSSAHSALYGPASHVTFNLHILAVICIHPGTYTAFIRINAKHGTGLHFSPLYIAKIPPFKIWFITHHARHKVGSGRGNATKCVTVAFCRIAATVNT